MQVKIHELATKEFDEAIEWYEIQSKGLGKQFKKSVIDNIKKIKKNPEWFLLEADNIHKAYIPKFPYQILFNKENNNSIIKQLEFEVKSAVNQLLEGIEK